MKSIIVFFLVLFLLISNLLYAQKKLKLTNKRSESELIIIEGTRIGYLKKNQFFISTGVLSHVTDSTFQVDEKIIPISKLKAIGKRKFGTVILECLSSALSGALLGGFGVNQNIVPSYRVLGGIGAGAFFLLALNVDHNNSPKNVIRDWKIKVID